MRPICEVENCPNPTRTLSAKLCEKHYYRLRRTGSTADPIAIKGECIVDGCTGCAQYVCDEPGRGFCRMHHLRRKKHGDINFRPIGKNNPKWTGDAASYTAVHQRLATQRGSARRHPCVDCGCQARQWSFNRPGNDHSYMPYSADLDQYVPRCVPCHKKHDLRDQQSIHLGYAAAKATGITAQIPNEGE